MKNFLNHLFLPHESNNYRAKLLHHSILLLSITLIFTFSFFLEIIKINFPSILGIQTNIAVEQLLVLTNNRRAEYGLSPLTLNPKLSVAAALKAKDMFAKDYWAHSSPDGKTPWVFIKEAGYSYTYAGENLARGFNSAEDVVNAWMASPKHRENMLFKNYSDVGFSVGTGKLKGQDTVLIVEEFGNQDLRAIASNDKASQSITTGSSTKNVTSPKVFASYVNKNKPLLNSLSLSLNLDKALLTLFILVLILDMVIVERKRIIRLVGHNTDHILFLALVVLIVAVFSKGVIL